MDLKTPPNNSENKISFTNHLEIHTNKHRIIEEPHQTPIRNRQESIPPLEIHSTKIKQKEFMTEIKSSKKHELENDEINELIFKNSALLDPINDDIGRLRFRTRLIGQNIMDNEQEMRLCLKKYDELCEVTEKVKKIAENKVVEKWEKLIKGRSSINSKCRIVSEIQLKRDDLEEIRINRYLEMQQLKQSIENKEREVS